MRINWSIKEIAGTSVVGILGMLADMGCLYLLRQYVFTKAAGFSMSISVGIAFFVGVLVNYVLAGRFVFINDKQQEYGKGGRAFVYYVWIFGIGFFMTEGLMLLGTGLIVGYEGEWYLLVKLVVSIIVFFWNYLARKIFIYRGT